MINETHNTSLTEFRVKVKTWTKCSDGLFRNVYKVKKTPQCSENTQDVYKNLMVPTTGVAVTKFKSSPRKGGKRTRP